MRISFASNIHGFRIVIAPMGVLFTHNQKVHSILSPWKEKLKLCLLSDSHKIDPSSKKSFIIVNHGLPIDPDYNILTESKSVVDAKCAWKSGKLKLNTPFSCTASILFARLKADYKFCASY